MKKVKVLVEIQIPEDNKTDKDEYGKDLIDLWNGPRTALCPNTGINEKYIAENVEECLTNEHYGISPYQGAKVLKVEIL